MSKIDDTIRRLYNVYKQMLSDPEIDREAHLYLFPEFVIISGLKNRIDLFGATPLTTNELAQLRIVIKDRLHKILWYSTTLNNSIYINETAQAEIVELLKIDQEIICK